MFSWSLKKENIIVIVLCFYFSFNAILFFYIHAIRVFFYSGTFDLFSLNLNSQESLKQIFLVEYFVVVSLISIPSLFELIRKRSLYLQYSFEKILFCFFPLIPLSALIGILNGNSSQHLFNDIISLSFLPTLYFLCNTLYYPGCFEKISHKLYLTFLTFALLDFGTQIFFFSKNINFVQSSIFFLFPLLYLLFLEKKRIIYYFTIFILILSTILSFKRTLWLILLFVFVIFVCYNFFYKKRIKKVMSIIALSFSLAVVIIFVFPEQLKYTALRFTQTVNSFSNIYNLENSIARRLLENYALRNSFQLNNPSQILFGRGLGAELNLADSLLPSKYYFAAGDGEFLIHTIHGTPQTFFFRTGLIGSSLYFLFCIFLIKIIWDLAFKKKFKQEYSIPLLFFLIIYLCFSTIAYMFWMDLFLLIFLLVASWLFRDYSYEMQGVRQLKSL